MCLGFRVWLQTSDYLVSGIVQLQGTIREYSSAIKALWFSVEGKLRFSLL